MTDHKRGSGNLLSKGNESKEEGCMEKLSKIKGKLLRSLIILCRLPLSGTSDRIFKYITYHD